MGSVGKHFYGIASSDDGNHASAGSDVQYGISMMVFSIQIGDVKITQQYYPQFISSISQLSILRSSVQADVCIVGKRQVESGE